MRVLSCLLRTSRRPSETCSEPGGFPASELQSPECAGDADPIGPSPTKSASRRAGERRLVGPVISISLRFRSGSGPEMLPDTANAAPHSCTTLHLEKDVQPPGDP